MNNPETLPLDINEQRGAQGLWNWPTPAEAAL